MWYLAGIVVVVVVVVVGLRRREQPPPVKRKGSQAGGLELGSDKAPQLAPETLLQLVRELSVQVLQEMGCQVAGSDDRLQVTAPDGSQLTCLLGNLSQVCRSQPLHAWPALVAAHFTRLLAVQQNESEGLELFADFDTCRPLLRVKLMDDESLSNFPEQGRTVLGDCHLPTTRTVLCIDFATAVRYVMDSDLVAWGQTYEELLPQALENCWASEQPWAVEWFRKDGGELFVTSSEEPYVSARALLLDRRPDLSGPHGVLLAVPNRHLLLGHKVTTTDALRASVMQLAMLAHRGFDEGPGSVSPDLFWAYEGSFTHIPLQPEGGKLRIQFSTKLQALLAG